MSRRIAGVEGTHAAATLVTGGAPVAAAEVALVLVHGRGGTSDGLIRLADECYRPGTALLAPGAVRSTWFPARHDAPIGANEPALTSAVDCVAATVGAAHNIGISPDETVLVGVSQGGCVVSEFLRRRPRRYGGAFVVSATLPGEDPADRLVVEGSSRPTADDVGPLRGTPIALDSSEGDPHVQPSRLRATAEVFRQAGGAVDLRIDPGDGHGLSNATLDRIGERLGALIAKVEVDDEIEADSETDDES